VRDLNTFEGEAATRSRRMNFRNSLRSFVAEFLVNVLALVKKPNHLDLAITIPEEDHVRANGEAADTRSNLLADPPELPWRLPQQA
jgi:REP element-mobilizing transposase RayT